MILELVAKWQIFQEILKIKFNYIEKDFSIFDFA